MNKMLLALSLVVLLLPSQASAYFVPLVGVAGVVGTALAGLVAVIFSAGFLIYYKISRFLRRKSGKDQDTTDTD